MHSALTRPFLVLVLLATLAMACMSPRSAPDGVKIASSAQLEPDLLEPNLNADTVVIQTPPTAVPVPAVDADAVSPLWRASRQPTTLLHWPDKFWAKNYRVTPLWSSAERNAESKAMLPQWSWLEFMGQQRNGRLLVRYPGDGRLLPLREAWVAATDIAIAPTPNEDDLPRAYPATLRPDVLRVRVPYRTQLDGTPWAAANCGPTSLGMMLESMGIDASSQELRKEALDSQKMWGDEAGVLVEALAQVAEKHGARVIGLSDDAGWYRWSPDDVRDQVRQSHPVVLQVLFRALPGREDSPYYGDHFVVITGLIGDDFLYNDPVDSDGVGYDRLMTEAQLQRAMNTSDRRYVHAGFALARR